MKISAAASARAMPRQVRSRTVIAATFLGCLLGLAAILWGEDTLTGSPTGGGLIIVIVLLATWLLPVRLAAVVNVFALAAPWAALALGDLDPVTTRLQFIAIVATVCLSEVTVRGLLARDQQQRHDAERLRRFAADAAHELRTPLTAMRADLETTLRRPRTPEQLTASLHDALRNTERLIRVSETLLTLARSDAGVLTLHASELDLADLIEETWSRWLKHAQDAHVVLTQQVEGHGSVKADPILLARTRQSRAAGIEG